MGRVAPMREVINSYNFLKAKPEDNRPLGRKNLD
jgi:hypothetical protein